MCGSGWTLREITPSPGYTVDPTVYEIGAEPGDFTIAANSLDMNVPERIIKGTLVILKQDEEITLYNSMVFGIHNYYRYATMVATDCEQIHRNVSTVMKNRLYGRLTKKGHINEVYIQEHYGKSKINALRIMVGNPEI